MAPMKTVVADTFEDERVAAKAKVEEVIQGLAAGVAKATRLWSGEQRFNQRPKVHLQLAIDSCKSF